MSVLGSISAIYLSHFFDSHLLPFSFTSERTSLYPLCMSGKALSFSRASSRSPSLEGRPGCHLCICVSESWDFSSWK